MRARIRGIDLVYEDEGSGPALLLIHGHPFDHSMWRPQIEALRQRARVIAPDLRGYGRSGVEPGTVLLDEMALDLAVLLDHIEIPEAVVCGLSMGGQIAFDFCRLFPHRVRGLVIAASSPAAETKDGYERRYGLARRLMQEGMAGYADEEAERFTSRQSRQRLPELAAHVRSMILGTNPVGASAALRGRAERRDHVGILPSIDVPVLVVVGDEDEFSSVEEGELMARSLPQARLIVLPGTGHLPNLEEPERFNYLLSELLDDPPLPRGVGNPRSSDRTGDVGGAPVRCLPPVRPSR